MADLILIRGLELSAWIGVPDDERLNAQRLTADLSIYPATGFDGLGDDLANTVNYFAVAKTVQAVARDRPRRLLETLACEIASTVLENFTVASVEVELRKYILPDTEFVAVKITRSRTGGTASS